MGHSLDPLDERDTARSNALNDARTESTAYGASGSSSGLRALSDLDDLDIAEGEPDIRGWDVRDSAGDRIGEVDDLIIDLTAMKVRYMAVELDKDYFSLDDTRRVLVPIGNAQLDDDDDDVIISATRESLLAMPAYDDDTFTDEQSTHDQFARPWTTGSGSDAASTSATTGSMGAMGGMGSGSTSGNREDLYQNDQFNDKNFFGSRRGQDRQDQSYLRRHEEELRLGKREVEGGEVTLQKTVETEHVSKSVPLRHEEVEIERRPLSGDAASGGTNQIGEDEIRITLMAEEVVAERRIVPKEEIIVKKRMVEEEETVEADLRRERIDVDDNSRTQRGNRSDSLDPDSRI